MWIPYDIRASLKADSSRDTLRLSQEDPRPRDFVVGFFLRNPVTQAWELDLVADEHSAELPAGPELPNAYLSLHPNQAGKLAEVIYRLPAGSATEALELAHADMQRRMLRWLVEIGRGMAIAGWRVADIAHGARWRCTPFRPSAMQVNHAALSPLDADLAPVVELFQRARNAPDAASRLLAGFAVLVAALRHPAMAGSGAGALRITQEMLVHAGALALSDQLLDLSLPELVATLRPEHDRLVGTDRVLLPVLDDLAGQRRLAVLANLADLAAHRLIVAEIRARQDARAPAVLPPVPEPVEGG
ncbi:MAG TPA: methylamine utilization protein MauJ [Paracoccus solventivorans]|uniref:methylamine utilization protein MauJ n=1 Tax=Paracoccus solventivorans TaxID=53463 RepID=UPI002C5C75B6|nr:methylamine utilization protein MauJ [Paracoccus solventivorans]HMM09465.1 methylamine utilization protein MauJ [Paracoccus solventivorans]